MPRTDVTFQRGTDARHGWLELPALSQKAALETALWEASHGFTAHLGRAA